MRNLFEWFFRFYHPLEIEYENLGDLFWKEIKKELFSKGYFVLSFFFSVFLLGIFVSDTIKGGPLPGLFDIVFTIFFALIFAIPFRIFYLAKVFYAKKEIELIEKYGILKNEQREKSISKE